MNDDISLDVQAIYLISAGGPDALKDAMSIGVKPEFLDGAPSKALAFMVDHHKEHGSIPDSKDLQNLFGHKVLYSTTLASGFVFQELMNRELFRHIAGGTSSIQSFLKSNDPHKAYAALQELMESSKEVGVIHVKPTPLWGLGGSVLSEYELIESGALGIPSPWPKLDAMTMGWWPKTNTWFVARPGVGKTWTGVICGLYAWEQSKEKGGKPCNVLIISPEMSKPSMAERFFSTKSKSAYGDVVGGTLGVFAKAQYFDAVNSMKDESGIWIMDATDGLTPERIEAAIDAVEADLVFIDSVYKIKWKERAKDRFDNMYAGVDTISSWAKRDWKDGRSIAIIAASQMNREGGKKGGSQQSSVALADNLSWEADNLFFLEQSTDMKKERRLKIVTGKCRRMAGQLKEMFVNWDMESMDFSEVVDQAGEKTSSLPGGDWKGKPEKDGFGDSKF